MGVMITGIIIGFLFVLILVVLVRTILFVPQKQESVKAESITLNEEKIVADMVEMIRCKTISDRDEEKIDRQEFSKFEELLKERFPYVHKFCTFEKIGKTGLLYYLKGENSDKPSVCMAHYDVVPVEEDGWSKPAFDGIIEDGYIWGRGTLDTKGTLCGVMEAVEILLAETMIADAAAVTA